MLKLIPGAKAFGTPNHQSCQSWRAWLDGLLGRTFPASEIRTQIDGVGLSLVTFNLASVIEISILLEVAIICPGD